MEFNINDFIKRETAIKSENDSQRFTMREMNIVLYKAIHEALHIHGVVGRSEQLFCHTCKNEMPENEGGNCCLKCWNEKYGAK